MMNDLYKPPEAQVDSQDSVIGDFTSMWGLFWRSFVAVILAPMPLSIIFYTLAPIDINDERFIKWKPILAALFVLITFFIIQFINKKGASFFIFGRALKARKCVWFKHGKAVCISLAMYLLILFSITAFMSTEIWAWFRIGSVPVMLMLLLFSTVYAVKCSK